MVVSFSRKELKEKFKDIPLNQIDCNKIESAYSQSFFKANLVLFVDGDNCVVLKRRMPLTNN